MSARLLLIDNYDSFTYNLVQGFLVLGAEVRGVPQRCASRIDEARALAPTHLCISPGPGTPQQAGVSMRDDPRLRRPHPGARRVPRSSVDRRDASAAAWCAPRRLMHGKTSPIEHDGRGVFDGVPSPCEVGRYHSLIAAPESMPAELRVTARTPRGRDHGRAPPALERRGRAVSSRERADAARDRR